MLLKNSFSTFLGNIELMYKVLLFIFILFIICSALVVLIFDPIVETIVNGFNWDGEVKAALNSWLNGNTHAFSDFFAAAKESISHNMNDFYIGMGLFAGVVFMFKFFSSFVVIPVADVLYNKMSKNYKVRLRNSMIANFAKSVVFGFLYSIISLVADTLIVVISYFLSKWLYGAVGFLSITIGAIVGIVLLSARIAILSQWVPLIVAKKYKILKAFGRSFKISARNFKSTIAVFSFIVIMFLAIVTCTSIPTFFIIPIIAFPAYTIIKTAVDLLTYFKDNKEKFYLDEKTVV